MINEGLAAARAQLPEVLEDADNGLTLRSREVFSQLLDELREIDGRYKDCKKQIDPSNRSREVCGRLNGILGVGSLIASAVYAVAGDGEDFVNGSHFSAWVGLVPAQHTSGGKATLLGSVTAEMPIYEHCLSTVRVRFCKPATARTIGLVSGRKGCWRAAGTTRLALQRPTNWCASPRW